MRTNRENQGSEDRPAEIGRNVASVIAIVVAGGIGGILPTVARLAATYVGDPAVPLPKLGLYVGLSMFFALGAAVAFMMKEPDARKAMVLGIAAPGIITNILAGASGVTSEQLQSRAAFMFGIGAAVAADTASAPLSKASYAAPEITVVPSVTGPGAKSSVSPMQLQFIASNNGVLQTQIVDARSKSTVAVPIGAKSVRIISNTNTADVTLPVGTYTSADLRVTLDAKQSSDFLWALGGARRARIQSVETAIQNIKTPEKAVDTTQVIKGTQVVTPKGKLLGVVESFENGPGEAKALIVRPE